MILTVKTLKEKGFSQRAISSKLGISRKTVKNFFIQISNAKDLDEIKTPQVSKIKKLDPYSKDIKDWLEDGLTGVLINEQLVNQKGLNVSYATVSRFIKQFKVSEVYIPLLAKPGEEAQVDFGYLGRFIKDGKPVKVWCFSIVLSNSRYSYNTIVTNQSVKSFIEAHIEAFEFFGGVPDTVKIDNLKAGVITPDFYEPVIQRQYAEFLKHYNSLPITARIRRGQDKGKVEASVKYIKNNFLKRISHQDFYQLKEDILDWTNNICNRRLHGTTKKIPLEVFIKKEKESLHTLPTARYEILKIEQRKVNNYGHISFQNNFYSVPYSYIGKTLILKSTNSLLRIFDDTTEVALHPVCNSEGEFVSKEEHFPPEKQKKTEQEFIDKALVIGENTLEFLLALKEDKPYQWIRVIKGVFKLEKLYDNFTINSACKKAFDNNMLNLITVKNICKNNWNQQNSYNPFINNPGGFAHELKKYDLIFNN